MTQDAACSIFFQNPLSQPEKGLQIPSSSSDMSAGKSLWISTLWPAPSSDMSPLCQRLVWVHWHSKYSQKIQILLLSPQWKCPSNTSNFYWECPKSGGPQEKYHKPGHQEGGRGGGSCRNCPIGAERRSLNPREPSTPPRHTPASSTTHWWL